MPLTLDQAPTHSSWKVVILPDALPGLMQKVGVLLLVYRIRVKRFGVEVVLCVSQSGVLLQQSLEVSCFRVLELLEGRRNQGRRVTE